MAFTVAHRRWDVERGGRTYLVQLEDEYFLGKRVIRVDGRVAYEGRTILSDHSGMYQFDLGGSPAFLKISTNGLTYSYTLILDGASAEHQPPPIDKADLVQQLPTPLDMVGSAAWMIGLVAILLWIGDGRLWREPLVTVAGTPVVAEVLTKRIDSRGGRSVQYRFSAGGRTFTRIAILSPAEYDSAAATGRVPIRYLAVAPDVSAPQTEPGDLLFDLALVALFAAYGVYVGLGLSEELRMYRTARRLRAFGSDATAHVTGSSLTRNRGGIVTGCVLRYAYRGPEFTEHTGRTGRFGLGA